MKKVTGYIKLQIPAGKANPAPPVGPALGQHGVNIMDFCKQFNARTQAQAKDDVTFPCDHGVSRIARSPSSPRRRRRPSSSRRRWTGHAEEAGLGFQGTQQGESR